MPSPVLRKFRFVRLRWMDAASSRGWRDKQDAGMTTVESIGFLVAESTQDVSISTSLDSGGKYVDILSIPRAAILARRNLSCA